MRSLLRALTLSLLCASLSALRLPSPTRPSRSKSRALSRRDLAAALSTLPLLVSRPALAGIEDGIGVARGQYDTVAQQEANFAEMEKRRTERAARIKRNQKEAKPYLTKIAEADGNVAFAAACDEFSVWLIGKQGLPDGLEPPAIRDIVNDSYAGLKTRPYDCAKTRTNKGVCYSPGEPADSAYKVAIRTTHGALPHCGTFPSVHC